MASLDCYPPLANAQSKHRIPASTQICKPQRSHSSTWINRRYSYAQSTASLSSTSSTTTTLRLAEVAKQHGLGIHVENWREDQLPVRQYLPLQHIIGSLKRDRDEKVRYRVGDDSPRFVENRRTRDRQREVEEDLSALSPQSDDSFSDMLRSSKRRRTSQNSSASSQCTANSDPDRRFSYQTTDRVAKELPRAALPGLNIALNLATLTAEERDVFSEYAPKHLEDPQILMNEVLQLRERMMNEEYNEDTDEWTDDTNDTVDGDFHSPEILFCDSPIIPLEREAEVEKAFEDFVNFSGTSRSQARS